VVRCWEEKGKSRLQRAYTTVRHVMVFVVIIWWWWQTAEIAPISLAVGMILSKSERRAGSTVSQIASARP
jgi:Na+/H+-translocating membrane pyrophosphatase